MDGERIKGQARQTAGTGSAPDSGSPTVVELEALLQERDQHRQTLLLLLEDLEESRRQVEHARREWMQAFDAVDDAIFVHDHEGRVTRCNRAYAERAGQPIRQIIGRPYWEVFPLREGPLASCVVSAQRAAEPPHDEEIVLDSGEIFLSRAFVIDSAGEGYAHSIHVLQDVTVRRRLEAERHTFSEALRQSAEGIALVDGDLRITYVNAALCGLLCRTADDLVGHPVAELFADDGQALVASAKAVVDRDVNWSGEAELQDNAGNRIPVQISGATVRDADGRLLSYVGTIADLRDLKQSQQRVDALRRAIEDLSTEADIDLLGRKAVRAALRLTGADFGAVALLDEASGLLGYRWLEPTDEQVRMPGNYGQPFAADRGLAGAVFSRRQPLIISDYHGFPSRLLPFAEIDAGAAAGVPVQIAGVTIGVLAIGVVEQADIFNQESLVLLESIARQIGVALQRQRLVDGLRNSEAHLLEKERVLTTLMGNLPGMAYRAQHDGQCTMLFVSDGALELTGYTADELLAGRPRAYRDLIHPEDRPVVKEQVDIAIEHGQPYRLEYRIVTASERVRWVWEQGVLAPQAAEGPVLEGFITDITWRKTAEDAMAASERRYRELVDYAPVNILVLDGAGKVLFANPAALVQIGADHEDDLVGHSIGEFVAPERRAEVLDLTRAVMERGEHLADLTMETRRLDGSAGYMEFSALPLDYEGQGAVQVIARDVTARHLAEQMLAKSNRALKTLSTCNTTLVHATDEAGLLNDICQRIVEQGGYAYAWVGYLEYDAGKTLRPVGRSADDDGFLGSLGLTWAEEGMGHLAPGEAARTGKVVAATDILADPAYALCRPMAEPLGVRSLVSLPLGGDDGAVFGVLNIGTSDVDAFDADELKLLEELAGDLAFGVMNLRSRIARLAAERDREAGVLKLQTTLVDTIQAMAMALEKRDPYTAGHQRRVSDLAVAIARELGFSADRIEGVRLGALIHDLGKIYVPAEILSRPGRITDAEFAIIKTHPTVGYDIVKGIDFPWPVAEMVYQHHERLDGSGYPQGLRGEEIALEARILAVADVTEAIASHRPYRPAQGLESALGELERGRGTSYDPDVVDACLRLFHDGRFAFASHDDPR